MGEDTVIPAKAVIYSVPSLNQLSYLFCKFTS